MTIRRIDLIGAVLAVMVLGSLPLVFDSRYLLGVLTVAAIYGIWSVSWDFMSGLTGRENFGHSLFIGVGAYAAGFLNTELGANAWWSLPVGMLAAVETWTKRDHKKEWQTWLSWLKTISDRVTKLDGVTTKVFEPTDLSNHSPVLNVFWDPAKYNITGDEVAEEFGRNKPRIAVGSENENGLTGISITTGQMQPGDEQVVADRIVQFLPRKRDPKPKTMVAPSANLQGRWDVEVSFFSSKSMHQWTLEQDGNWLQGDHKGEYTTREIMGTIEGNEVKLRSVDRHPADGITFTFSGKCEGDKVSGQIHLGEYRTATFIARKAKFNTSRKKIMVPGGPPLAT